MKKRRNFVAAFCCLLSVWLTQTLSAEQAKVIIEANALDFPNIRVIANIRDSDGDPISGILPANISIQESEYKVNTFSLKEKAADAVEPIDIVFVFDTTGSMNDEIKSVRDNIIEFADVLRKTNMDYRLGLVTFGDNIREVHQPMANVREFKRIIGNQTADGGDDEPENALDALYKASELNFRDGVKIVFILITDAPFHMNNHITKLHTLTALKKIKEQNITVYTLAPRLERYLWIAAETSGVYHDVTANFSKLVQQLSASLTAQYVIQFVATNQDADAGLRKVKLKLDHSGYKGEASSEYRAPSNIEVSSYLIERKRPKDAYAPKNVFDGKTTTAWFEGSPDDGIGEWLKVNFSKPKRLEKIGLIAGYPKTHKLFGQNNRIKTAMVILSNGDTQVLNLKDVKEMQHFKILSKSKTSYLKIVISSVYRGSRYRDTCITELEIN